MKGCAWRKVLGDVHRAGETAVCTVQRVKKGRERNTLNPG